MSAITSSKSTLAVVGRNNFKKANVILKHDKILGVCDNNGILPGRQPQLQMPIGNKRTLSTLDSKAGFLAGPCASQSKGILTAYHPSVASIVPLPKSFWASSFVSNRSIYSNAFLPADVFSLASSAPQKSRYQQLHHSGSCHIFNSFSTSESKKESQSEAKQDNSTDTGGAANSEESAGSSEEVGLKSLKDQIEKINSENNELKAKSEDLLDKYRRAIAENDNMRKRLTKQIEDAKIFGIQGFCKDLLDVADVLQKAVDAARAAEASSGSSLAGGIELTQNQMHQVFNRHGLLQIAPIVGETKFDPNKHEAMFQIPAPDKDPNIIMDVQKIGYSLHGRTIRPAIVGVSKK